MKENKRVQSEVDKLMTVADIASVLGIQPNTIHSRLWQRRSGCPLFKVGKRIYSVPRRFQRWIVEKNVADNQ